MPLPRQKGFVVSITPFFLCHAAITLFTPRFDAAAAAAAIAVAAAATDAAASATSYAAFRRY